MTTKTQYDRAYEKANLKQIKLALNTKTDQDVIDHLTSQPNIRQYLIRLIR